MSAETKTDVGLAQAPSIKVLANYLNHSLYEMWSEAIYLISPDIFDGVKTTSEIQGAYYEEWATKDPNVKALTGYIIYLEKKD